MRGVALLTNTDLTVLRREYDEKTRLDVWKSEYVPEAWWHKNESASVDLNGIHKADNYTIRIPNISVKLKKDDYIVKGAFEESVQSPKDLLKYDVEFCKITSVNYNTFGLNPHIKTGGQRRPEKEVCN